MAQLGRLAFFDPSLSASGTLSCASCHSPQRAYGPPSDRAVMLGGASMSREGVRAVPSLMYLERQPNFGIGTEDPENDADGAGATPAPPDAVPQGGLFWDGRANTLQDQALGPLLNPLEMDGGSIERVAAKLRRASYAPRIAQLFGADAVRDAPRLVSEVLFAIGRYQFEDPSFHPYTSKFDRWLEGKASFSPAEARGFVLFNDPKGANCAACHLDRPTADGLPPLLTDHEFEALAVPRNAKLAANRNPAYFDLGVCGPVRTDMRDPRYCGMFLTPTLRNAATRNAFFHNGVYRTLAQVLDFYDYRTTRPARVYPHGRIDDLPQRYAANVDVTDAPFDRTPRDGPPLTPQQERDVIAFLRTLTDGYRP